MTDTPSPEVFRRDGGATIAYHSTPGKLPGVVFLGGFRSDMTGGKALALEQFCREGGRAFLRFDYSGHGESSGAFTDGTIGGWADDAVAVLDALTDGPQVLVGSSMGGWIMLLAALRRPQRVAGLIGIAAAADFTEELMWDRFTDTQKAALERHGVVHVPNDYEDAEPDPITRGLIEDGRNHLLLGAPIGLRCPVRLIHGMVDPDVPWQTSERIADRLEAEDVEVILVEGGGHRLSEPEDLDRLTRTLEALLARIEG